MKKSFRGLICGIVIVCFIGFNIYTLQNETKLSDLTLANMEALAYAGESLDGDEKFVVPSTEEVSRESMGNYIVVTYRHTVACLHGGYESCSPSSSTSQFIIYK